MAIGVPASKFDPACSARAATSDDPIAPVPQAERSIENGSKLDSKR
jgi:hypothetical protein